MSVPVTNAVPLLPVFQDSSESSQSQRNQQWGWHDTEQWIETVISFILHFGLSLQGSIS